MHVKSDGLVCPLDGRPLSSAQGRLHCDNGHSYDLAKQGYCHLLPVQQKRSADPGDSKAMVQARRELLDSGAYRPLVAELLQMVTNQSTGALRIADAGCGEGYYLNQIKLLIDSQQGAADTAQLIGYDISKWAVQAATKRSKAIRWLVASSKNIPIANDYLDVMFCMFGFPVWSEFARVLAPGGKVILVDAGPQHLIELRTILYDEIKPHKEWQSASAEQAGFEQSTCKRLPPYQVELNKQQIETLALMTPHFFRAPAANKIKLAALAQLDVTIDVEFRELTLR
ncbi:methyltransferase domain-containing protein [Neiella sp. HB171785]|uniref:Methyltransferase domain-containing protein n=1 Tax=Neiella litorisoli TaxID=2771431 RepID=A0A8J6UF87_9GAMM|nr:methyltransferase domain-containing protein [Neiella litorisoli]MBD1388576.1 methyltransferase domain-containing protein [Neiella litorisoli]